MCVRVPWACLLTLASQILIQALVTILESETSQDCLRPCPASKAESGKALLHGRRLEPAQSLWAGAGGGGGRLQPLRRPEAAVISSQHTLSSYHRPQGAWLHRVCVFFFSETNFHSLLTTKSLLGGSVQSFSSLGQPRSVLSAFLCRGRKGWHASKSARWPFP